MAGAFQSKLICMVAKVYIEEEKKDNCRSRIVEKDVASSLSQIDETSFLMKE
jgi:hypothetical protein